MPREGEDDADDGISNRDEEGRMSLTEGIDSFKCRICTSAYVSR